MGQLVNVNASSAATWKKMLHVLVQAMLIFTLVFACYEGAKADYYCDGDIWSKSETALEEIYGNVKSLSGYVAGTMFVIALAFALFSKDQRKVDVAVDWAKRIVIIYLVILAAGWIFQYGKELVSGAPDIFGGTNS